MLAVASIRERLIFEYPQKRSEIEKEIEELIIQRETLKDFLLQLGTLKTPKDAIELLTDGTDPKAIENRKSGS